MIIYADSSSIVKLYMQEVGSNLVRSLRDQVETVFGTSRIAYAEARAALSRGQRASRFASQADYRRAVRDFNRDWRLYFLRKTVSEGVVRLAGDLAERHALRGYDAVHLASALMLEQRLGTELSLSTWDSSLREAASTEGLVLAHTQGDADG